MPTLAGSAGGGSSATAHTGEYPLAAPRRSVPGYIADTNNLITAYAIDEAAHHSSGLNGRAQTAS